MARVHCWALEVNRMMQPTVQPICGDSRTDGKPSEKRFRFLADQICGRTYGTSLCLSVCLYNVYGTLGLRIVAKWTSYQKLSEEANRAARPLPCRLRVPFRTPYDHHSPKRRYTDCTLANAC